MKFIFVNLKRFDIQPVHGGVNRIAPGSSWGNSIAGSLHRGLMQRPEMRKKCTFAAFFPESHIPAAVAATRPSAPRIPANHGAAAASGSPPTAQDNQVQDLPVHSPLAVGCQSVHHADTAPGGNFGAFTTLRTANAMRELGCEWTIIGHSEERRYKAELMHMAGATAVRTEETLHAIFAMQTRCALNAGLKVLYCIGENAEEIPDRLTVLTRQIQQGLAGINLCDTTHPDPHNARIVLAYEPVWAIGPGKTPPSPTTIQEIAAVLKTLSPLPLVYGGGLKKENARAIGAIPELDGGLVALTRFSGEIGFYPEEFLEIVDSYVSGITNDTPGTRAAQSAPDKGEQP